MTGSACLHELIEAQVAMRPDVVAVRCGGRALTYARLNDRANQVACALRALGVTAESPVGLVADRSVDAVAGLLGVLKAGGAYVPLDPAHPARRLAFLGADAGVVAVVGAGSHAGVAAAVGTVPFVAVPTAETGVGNPPLVTTPDNLAYVIYTSGSTGAPKGVAVSHAQLVASTAARWVYPDPGTDLLTFPLTFDAAAGGLHWMLTRGGTCLMVTEAELRDPRLMADLVRAHTITHVNTIHSQYRLILEETTPADLAALRYVDVGGEPLPPDLVAEHYRRTPDAVLCNCYGPTETTVWAATCDCRPAHGLGSSVPIGKPVRGAVIHLLDAGLTPVPDGTPAELFVGGPIVSRGYVGRPALTAERFLPDPFGAVPGARMYRTGDRALRLANGEIEFLGRVDHQVKIRGFRVELGEVEQVVRGHPDITEAAVTVRRFGLGEQRLVAHLVGTGDRLVEGVRERVAAHLPDYMCPAEYRVLERLPKTSAGKVDRVALAGPAEDVPRPDGLTDDQVDGLLRHLLAGGSA